ncbi:MAG: DoxX family membrane protein [Alphaproteobacteria bacterium]|nr:DoxX family membrane protein [Alphaproteobacteria bacterium]
MTAVALRQARHVLGRFPMPVLELAFRIGVGMVFFKSSLTKLDDAWLVSDSAVALFQGEYKVPILPPRLAATLGTAVEFFGSLMLMAGFGARLAAAALLGLTAVIQFTVYPGNWAEHLLWAGLLAYILTRGPGPISVDRLIAQWLLET